ncbi:MAG: hypothetical protein N3G76_01925 [Candidatus Micrarchaeota archaeon]|nr:hypothetical protein [Candidatus Micrarchaeota archaeon]
MYDKIALSFILMSILLSCQFLEGQHDEGDTGAGTLPGTQGYGQQEEKGTGTSHSSQQMLQLCTQIKTQRWKQMCNAVFSGDASKCESQRQYGLKEACESMIIAVKKQPKLCDTVNRYVTGVNSKGEVVNTTFETDCYGHYAITTLNEVFCEKSQGPSSCRAEIKYEKGEVTISQCNGDSICLVKYAKHAKDANACEQLKPGFAGADPKSECMAMITGDERYCDKITSVDSKYYCIGMARARKVLDEGFIAISSCNGNSDCEREVLFEMEKWAARN